MLFRRLLLARKQHRDADFIARLEYELNCMSKYDDPLGIQPSKYPPKGERMEDYAERYGVTVDDMKRVLPAVEKFLDMEVE